MVIGEGFIHHQEHDAGEEGQGQNNQNSYLKLRTNTGQCVPKQ